jgi:putative transposase
VLLSESIIAYATGTVLEHGQNKGTKAYRITFDLLYCREAGTSNDIWQADHTLLDLWVQQGSGSPARPWLTVIMDDSSRAK